MRFGPTSLRVAGVLAKGLRRPKLRQDMRVSEQVIGGQTTYMIKIPDTEYFIRYGAYEWQILQLCDGTRTAADIAAAMTELFPDSPVEESEIVIFLDNLHPNFWERNLGERNLAVLEKIRDERKQRAEGHGMFNFYVTAWDPEKILTRVYPYIRWMYTRGFALFSVALFVATFLIVAADWTRIHDDTVEFYTFTHKSAYDLWIFWFLLFVVSGVHEFGHGLTCKHYGGEVHRMGLLLIYFSPAFFTDCSDMYLFDQTRKRLWTIFAGIWIELVMCSLGTLIWFFSPPGSFIGDLGYKLLLLTGVSGIFFNLNPLMKYDGYYALSQYTQIDNLREDSFDYLKAWVKRYLLFQKTDLPPVGRRKRWIFLLYGTGAFLYSTLVIVLITLLVRNIFTSRFGDWGYLLTGGVVYLLLRSKVKNWVPAWRAGLGNLKERFMAWRMTRLQQVAGVALFIVVFIYPPTAITVSTDFILEPGERADVRAGADGWVKEVLVREGETVPEGAVLAQLSNPQTEAQAATLENERTLAERQLLTARARSDLAEIQQYQKEMERVEAALREARHKQEGLTLRTPVAGVVTTPWVEQQVGAYLTTGAILAEVADRRTMRARVLVRDWELEDVAEGAPVKLNARAYPLRTFSGTVTRILPAAALDRPVSEPTKLTRKGQELTNFFAVMLEFPNQQGPDGHWVLREGMTGTAKVYGKRYPLGVRVARSSWRWARSLIIW